MTTITPLALVVPFVELWSPGRLHTGERFFVLDYHVPETEGGGICGVWNGTSYEEGLAAGRHWQASGMRFLDHANRGVAH